MGNATPPGVRELALRGEGACAKQNGRALVRIADGGRLRGQKVGRRGIPTESPQGASAGLCLLGYFGAAAAAQRTRNVRRKVTPKSQNWVLQKSAEGCAGRKLVGGGFEPRTRLVRALAFAC